MDLVEFFDQLAADHDKRDAASRNRRGSLVRDGGVRAMTSRGHVVVRLSVERAAQLVADGAGRPYKGQRNAWLELDPSLPHAEVRRLVEEALA